MKVVCISLPCDDKTRTATEIAEMPKRDAASANLMHKHSTGFEEHQKIEIGKIYTVLKEDTTPWGDKYYWMENGWIFAKYFVSLPEYRQTQLEKIGI